MQNVIRNRVRVREVRLPSDGRVSRSTGRNGSARHRSSETSACMEGLSRGSHRYLPLSRGFDETGHHPVTRARREESSRGAEMAQSPSAVVRPLIVAPGSSSK